MGRSALRGETNVSLLVHTNEFAEAYGKIHSSTRGMYMRNKFGYIVVRNAGRQDFSEILKGIMKEDFLTPSPRTPDVRAGLHKRSVYYGQGSTFLQMRFSSS